MDFWFARERASESGMRDVGSAGIELCCVVLSILFGVPFVFYPRYHFGRAGASERAMDGFLEDGSDPSVGFFCG